MFGFHARISERRLGSSGLALPATLVLEVRDHALPVLLAVTGGAVAPFRPGACEVGSELHKFSITTITVMHNKDNQDSIYRISIYRLIDYIALSTFRS